MKFPRWLLKYKTDIPLQEDGVPKDYEPLLKDFVKVIKTKPNKQISFLINGNPYTLVFSKGKIQIKKSEFTRS